MSSKLPLKKLLIIAGVILLVIIAIVLPSKGKKHKTQPQTASGFLKGTWTHSMSSTLRGYELDGIEEITFTDNTFFYVRTDTDSVNGIKAKAVVNGSVDLKAHYTKKEGKEGSKITRKLNSEKKLTGIDIAYKYDKNDYVFEVNREAFDNDDDYNRFVERYKKRVVRHGPRNNKIHIYPDSRKAGVSLIPGKTFKKQNKKRKKNK